MTLLLLLQLTALTEEALKQTENNGPAQLEEKKKRKSGLLWARLLHRGLRQSDGVYLTRLSAGIRFVMTPLDWTAAVSTSTLLKKSAYALGEIRNGMCTLLKTFWGNYMDFTWGSHTLSLKNSHRNNIKKSTNKKTSLHAHTVFSLLYKGHDIVCFLSYWWNNITNIMLFLSFI